MYKIALTKAAASDLQQIHDHIAHELLAPDSAASLIRTLRDAIRKSAAYPLALPPVNDPHLRAKGYRRIIVKSYTVFVIPDEDAEVLNIMRVLYYRQDHRSQLP